MKTEQTPKHTLPDPYSGDLNAERIKEWSKLGLEYGNYSSARNIFNKGIDWYKSKLENEEDSTALKALNNELLEALEESTIQIKYLHEKFVKSGGTGTGNAVISRNESLISKCKDL